VACVSGVTGSNLKKRIEAIMENRNLLRLNFARKATLAAAGMAAVALPLVIGMLHAPALRAQAQITLSTSKGFDVASIKPNLSGSEGFSSTSPSLGSVSFTNVTPMRLIMTAYRLQNAQVIGGQRYRLLHDVAKARKRDRGRGLFHVSATCG
jgi:hypothetical protein